MSDSITEQEREQHIIEVCNDKLTALKLSTVPHDQWPPLTEDNLIEIAFEKCYGDMEFSQFGGAFVKRTIAAIIQEQYS